MPDIASIIGPVGGAVGTVVAVFSLLYLRRQTQIAETQLDKRIEVTITRDLDAPEGAVNSKVRTYLNGRLSDIRRQMRDEFGARLDELGARLGVIEQGLHANHLLEYQDIVNNAVRLVNEQKDAINSFGDYQNRVATLAQDLQRLQSAYDDIRNGVGDQEMVRRQIRGIAEQLLKMTGPQYGA